MKNATKCTINLSNSIIGVSLLAMPLCFKQCGIILSLMLVLISFLVNRFSCYLLLKSAIVNRRRDYEVLAFDVFGVTGKRIVEISVLLFLLGTCIAFFVVLGDISSSLVAQFFDVPNSPNVRTLIVTFLAMFAILPLGLLPNVDALTSFSMISLLVYCLLGMTMFTIFLFKNFSSNYSSSFESFDQTSKSILQSVSYWNFTNVISYLPIFSMALSCQSQLFEIFQLELYQAERDSLRVMMHSTNRALKICSFVYTFMGIFGYLAFYNLDFSGNILQMLPTGFITNITLLLFILSILTSFPLCLFPIRTSFHSLIFRKAGYHDLKNLPHTLRMTDAEFKCITITLIVLTLGISILFPHVELILALVGSTIGTLICFILPGMIFARLSDKNTIEYIMSFLLILFGIIILIFCTFSAVHKISVAREVEIETKIKELIQQTTTPIAPNISNSDEPFLKTEFKAKINNITKLKESIQKDLNTFQKNEDEELLHKLEKQQKEQSKIIAEQAKIIKELSSNVKQLKEDNVVLSVSSADSLQSSVNTSIFVKNVIAQVRTVNKDALPSAAVPVQSEFVRSNLSESSASKQPSVVLISGSNASPASVAENFENNPSINANKLNKQKHLSTFERKLSLPNHFNEREPLLQKGKLKEESLSQRLKTHSQRVKDENFKSFQLSSSSYSPPSSSSSSSSLLVSASHLSNSESLSSKSVQQSENGIKQTNILTVKSVNLNTKSKHHSQQNEQSQHDSSL